jgi:peptide chain release factor 3
MRDIPIVTFINKMDREAREPLELLDEIEKTLALDVTPATWPIGSGRQFAGVYDMAHSTLRLLGEGGERDEPVSGLDDPRIDSLLGEQAGVLRESAEIASVYPEFELGPFREGHLTPIYFGSALRGFGVKHLLDGLANFAPPPSARAADARTVEPEEEKLSGFVFKIQANTDLNHRDRVAFLRICSGRLRKGARLKQVRTGKSIPVNAPLFFFAKERQVAEEAWPGDVVGIANHGVLRIGDTLTDGEELNFRGVPSFAPEILRRVRLDDPMLAKKLRKALDQLADEGVVQVFRPMDGSQPVVGVVGQLQLDVLSSRIQAEYGVQITFENTSWSTMRWVAPKEEGPQDRAALDRFLRTAPSQMAEDHDNHPVAFFTSDWGRKRSEDEWPMLRFLALREQHGVEAA